MVVQDKISRNVLVADEVWIALAMLHRRNPNRASFRASEIMEQVRKEGAHPQLRAGVSPHIYLHTVANIQPNGGAYRMLFKLDDDTYRLFRPTDHAHPRRKGKIIPDREDLSEKYHDLLDWYKDEYCARASNSSEEDPILRMWGMDKHLWAGVNADEYVTDLRAGWDEEAGALETDEGSTSVHGQVVAFLKKNGTNAYCDDCIAVRLHLKRRQQAQQVTAGLQHVVGFSRRPGRCSECAGHGKLVTAWRS